MSWNYRIVKYADGSGFGLHEVYYDEDGKEDSMSLETVEMSTDTPEELVRLLRTTLESIKDTTIFEEPVEWT